MGIPVGHMFRMSAIPPGKNPAELGGPRVKGTLDIRLRVAKRIHVNKLFDAILKGRAGGYPSDIKMMWSMCNNYVNQTGNPVERMTVLESIEGGEREREDADRVRITFNLLGLHHLGVAGAQGGAGK